MLNNRFWLNLLNIQQQEWPVVKQLFWLQFFQGAGISFFFTAEFARFLEKFPVHELPWVMVLSAALLWLTGLVYTIMEHHIPFKTFNEGIILFMAGTMLMVRMGSTFVTENWLYYVSLAWFYVLYLLNNLEFWGIASRLFNIRQSKRLFGVVSSGDIPAKFIGYTMALIFVPYTGTLNLLFLGVISMLLSIPFYRKLTSIPQLNLEQIPHENGIHHGHNPIRSLFQTFTKSAIIRRISIISLLASACIILVNYGFYAKIKESYQNDVALARFIATFMAGLRIAAMITKTIFTSRLTTSLGVQKSLFITPLMLVGMVSIIIGLSFLNPDERSVFYIFGASSIAVDVLRTAINSPVLLTIMQPLPIHERMKAHNIIKGIMDPFATLFCGFLLLFFFNFQQKIDLITICVTLLVLAGAWLAGIVYVNREYLNMLVKTISSRYFSQEEFSLNDPETFWKIKEKIDSGSEQEVLSILSMVASKQNPLSIELLKDFLKHPSRQVKVETIKLISRKEIRKLEPELIDFLKLPSDPVLQPEIIFAISKLTDSKNVLYPLLQSPDKKIKSSVLCGMLASASRSIRFLAEEQVTNLLRSERPEDKKYALNILQEAADDYDHPLLAEFLSTENSAELLLDGIGSIGKAASAESLNACLYLFPVYGREVKRALLRAGKTAIPSIQQFVDSKPSNDQLGQIIQIVGQIGGDESGKLLGRLIFENKSNQPAIIKALYRSKYKPGQDTLNKLEDIARAYTFYAAELLFMQRGLQTNGTAPQLLFRAIDIELIEIREILLCLFGILYDRENIQKSRNALLANKKETIANAIEIIDVTVKKDISKYFCVLYDNSSIEERCNALRTIYRKNDFPKINEIMERILKEQPIRYQDWTTACTLYISRKHSVSIDSAQISRYLNAENEMLKETARYALA